MSVSSEELFLRKCAPLVLRQSVELCKPVSDSSLACSWYHGVWPYFRILGVVSSPWVQSAFYLKILQEFAETEKYPRVLISGTSDHVMLAIVLNAYHKAGSIPEITVVDRCETPLLLNRWYAESSSMKITTTTSNLLNYSEEEKFDVICTHSFLGNFSPEQRLLLVARWRELLREGGKVVLVNRIRPGMHRCQKFSRQMTEDFVERLMRAGLEKQGEFDLSPQVLEDWGRAYAKNYQSYPVASLEAFSALFETQGFRVDSLNVEGNYLDTTGPSASGKAMRAHMVATRI